ncbi:MAG TPA: hypothetical protein VGX28_01130 [Frankiaceae bacterium]|jgi:hypothetical protein|nr:hypothetical protein [Frankiaceae bacterium]
MVDATRVRPVPPESTRSAAPAGREGRPADARRGAVLAVVAVVAASIALARLGGDHPSAWVPVAVAPFAAALASVAGGVSRSRVVGAVTGAALAAAVMAFVLTMVSGLE